MNVARKTAASAALVLTAVALSGCGSVGIEIADKDGFGDCGPDAEVSLQVTQDDGGDNVTIVYDGPTDVSIVAYQGPYSDTEFFDMLPTESFAFTYPIAEVSDDQDLALNVLDFTSSPWVSTITGSTIHAVYDESIDDLIDSLDYTIGTSDPSIDTAEQFDTILPITVAVHCTEGLTSMLLESVPVDGDGLVDGLEFAVAQPMYPNFMYIDSPVATGTEDITDGVSGLIEFPDELSDAMPDGFVPQSMSASVVYLGDRDPTLPPTAEQPWTLDGAALGELWWLTLYAGVGGITDTTFEFTGDYSLTEPVPFTFTGDGAAPESGYYLFFLAVSDIGTEIEVPENVKFVTAILRYTARDGVTFDDVTETPTQEKIAVTGGDPNVVIWAVLGGLVILAAVALRPKRRADQSESTIDPSARKE